MKKYELTSETKVVFGRTLHRIKALISFGDVKAGELGGWIEKEENLDKSDNAWVFGNARVCGNARVFGNAQVYDNAWVCGDARVCGNAQVYGDAQVYGNARVCGNARVYDNAQVFGDAQVYGDAWVCGNAQVYDNAWVCGDAQVCGNAQVCGIGAIFWVSAVGSRNDTATFFACKDKKIRVKIGCFFGDLEEFAAKVQETHGDNTYGKVYRLAIEMAKERIQIPDALTEDNNDED